MALGLDSLHDEELLKVFSYLPLKSKLIAGCVSKRFNYISNESIKSSVKSLALLESKKKEWLYGYEVIEKNYDLILSTGFNKMVQALSRCCSNVHSLCLYKCTDISDSNIHLLGYLPSLRTLCLSYINVSDSGMSSLLVQNPNLRTLHLSKLPLSGTFLDHISDQLKSLSLMGCYEIGEDALNRFGKSRGSQLERFMFEGPELKDTFLKLLTNESSQLNTLSLDCAFKPSIGDCLNCFHSLQSISLFFYESTTQSWTSLGKHQSFVNAQKLCLHFAKIESILLSDLLIMFPNIQELTIGFCSLETNLVSDLLGVIPKLKSLRQLTLSSRNWPLCSSFAELATGFNCSNDNGIDSKNHVRIGFLNEDQIYETVTGLRNLAGLNPDRKYSMELHASNWIKSQFLQQLTLPENLWIQIRYQSSHLYYDIHERIFELD